MAKARKSNKERAFDNIQKAREKVQAIVILDPNGKKVGGVIHRWTNAAMGAVCHTTFRLGSMDPNKDTVVMYEEAGGGGYDKAAHCMCWILMDQQEKVEAITNRPYPKDPDGGLTCYLANHWKQYLTEAGYTVIEAL